MREPVLRVPVRYYQIARLYGPGMPPSGREGFHTRIVEKLGSNRLLTVREKAGVSGQ